jgi:opacity protein-like surface antigen
MKKLFAVTMLCCTICSYSHAQAFEKKNVLLSLGLGAIDDFTGYSSGEHAFAPITKFKFYPVRPQFMFKAEFAVHKYWGVGFMTSVDGGYNMRYNYSPGYYNDVSMVNAQLGLLVNYHFYQLIADKFNRNPKLHADKLDLYTGFTIGAGINFSRINGIDAKPYVVPFMGLHLGARYYVTKRLSVFGEIGIGQSYFNTGITFKLAGTPKQKQIKKEF